MTTNVTDPTLDGQWLDFYVLLDVPVSADEDIIRRRIGKVYADAAANTEHRDMTLRMWYQSLVERVLPQARRVLLDPQWRAKYDRQHILHSISDPSAQNYVAFIAAMRGGEISNQPDSDLSQLPARVQDEINAAREVVECARAGLELELLPSQAVTTKPLASPPTALTPLSSPSKPEFRSASLPTKSAPKPAVAVAKPEAVEPKPLSPTRSRQVVAGQHEHEETAGVQTRGERFAPRKSAALQPFVEVQEGETVHAKTMTAQEARDLRRRRESNVDSEPFVAPASFHEKISGEPKLLGRQTSQNRVPSRVVVGEQPKGGRKRVLTPTSLNLLVAITGVLFTISIQKFAATPAIATSSQRMPVLLAASPEIAPALQSAEAVWKNTSDGQNFSIVVQELEGDAGTRRALNGGDSAPDAWVPVNNAAVDSFNALAPRFKRQSLAAGDSLARTPVVLMARSDRAGELRRRFPGHQISSWSALREAVNSGAQGRFGLSDPQKTAVGALVRFSMAREWGESNGAKATLASAKSPAFWTWMNVFESNSPSAYSTTGDMVNDLTQDGASRVWWGLAFESDALRAMSRGDNVEVWYLPRTILANHPFCDLERVGASVEVAAARQSFKRYLRSDDGQKSLLVSGLRPATLSLQTRVKGNPFSNAAFQARGVRQNLGRDERDSTSAMPALLSAWAKRFK